MTPEEIFFKYKRLPIERQKQIGIMVNMITDWEIIKNTVFDDVYLAGLKNEVENAITQVECMS